MKNNYMNRLLPFVCIRLSMNKWLDSKHLRPLLLKMGGVKLGKGCHIGQNVTFDTIKPSLFEIGNYVTITMNSVLLTHAVAFKEGSCERKHVLGRLKIEDHVFIGAGAIITRPLTIGKYSVVAAGAVVTKDVPSYTVVAGCPAKVIKHLPH